MNINKPLVSICCITYNHEKYIAEAIESFLMQKTNFQFEILIHDDASTDNTACIIREYEKKYPDIVKPVYQEENQYSKGVKVSGTYNFPRAKGKYIALCEGDDYWIDQYKIQQQVDYMESNPSCTLCFHAADIVDENGKYIETQAPYSDSKVCSVEDVICKKINYPTASLLFPTELAQKLPDFYFGCPVGDVPMQLYFSSCGYAYYFNKSMSAYRTGVENSWTYQMYKENNITKILEHNKQMIHMYSMFNEYTGKLYEKEVEDQINRCLFESFVLSKDFVNINKSKYIKYYKELPKIRRIKLKSNEYFPQIYKMVKAIKCRLKESSNT